MTSELSGKCSKAIIDGLCEFTGSVALVKAMIGGASMRDICEAGPAQWLGSFKRELMEQFPDIIGSARPLTVNRARELLLWAARWTVARLEHA